MTAAKDTAVDWEYVVFCINDESKLKKYNIKVRLSIDKIKI